MHCDTVKHECVPGAPPDMGMPDLMHLDDLSVEGSDLSGVDFAMPDLTPPPACVVSGTCPSPMPVCENNMCRACNAAGDDTVCAMRSAASPHCKLSGTNAGMCVACNVNADCPMATPTCNPDGTCRTCAANSDCDSKICTTATGACVPESDIVYVDNKNNPACSDTGKDGTRLNPYCSITRALMAIDVLSRHYVQIEGSPTKYASFNLGDTSVSVTLVGPGKEATTKAIIQSAHDMVGINIAPASNTVSVTANLQGLVFLGDGSQNLLVCSSGFTSIPNLTIVDCSFANSGNYNISVDKCRFTMLQSYSSGATKAGLILLGQANNFYVENNFFWGNATGVDIELANGRFSFNTVAYNATTEGIVCGAANVPIADSIVVKNKQNGGTQFTQSGGGSTCLLSNVVTGTDNYGSGQITLMPSPKSATDLHLDTTPGPALTANQACCIDKINGPGPTPSPSPLPTRDIDNQMRFQGASWDIGADEAM
jgi:hypothetical protein